MIEPFEYCTKCGLVYCHIQNFECVVCHGRLACIEGLQIPERKLTPAPTDLATPCSVCGCLPPNHLPGVHEFAYYNAKPLS